MKLVKRSEISEVVSKLKTKQYFGLDTETTGLKQSDRPFMLIIACDDEDYIFNLNPYTDIPLNQVLNASDLEPLQDVLGDPEKFFFIHNAKFDMRMIAHIGLSIPAPICTYAVERIVKNNHFGQDGYRLSGVSKRYFPETPKDDAVKKYISKHKCYTLVDIPGKAKREKEMHFEQVPWEIMGPYAALDARLHLKVGLMQLHSIPKELGPLLANEIALTKACFKMETTGIRIDKPYVAKALQSEMKKITESKLLFKEKTGIDFMDSNKMLAQVFDDAGEKYPVTAKGNPSFNADALESMDTPLAKCIKEIRNHEKKAGTYYSSFLYYSGDTDRIHPDMRQAGTETGRFSYRNPNLQNIPKEDEDGLDIYVRKCFIPSENHTMYMIDYKQQEFRLMLDYAGEHRLIKRINEGADVHQATADLLGVSRSQAKTINFGLLYGMGIQKLAASLGVRVKEAKDIKLDYFGKLPKVERLIKSVISTGRARGYIHNWYGRRCHIDSSDYAYILPNHLIQSSGADVIKIALNRIDEFLEAKKSTMLIQVHDEIVFDIDNDEHQIVPEIQSIMESVYTPKNGVKLDCSVEHSTVSWGYCDKVEGIP